MHVSQSAGVTPLQTWVMTVSDGRGDGPHFQTATLLYEREYKRSKFEELTSSAVLGQLGGTYCRALCWSSGLHSVCHTEMFGEANLPHEK